MHIYSTTLKIACMTMGQKAHPLALRHASKYRRQDTLWYSRRYRQELVLRDLALSNYMDTMSAQQHMPTPRLAVQHGHTGTHVYAYICIPFTERRDIAAQCRVKPTQLPAPVQQHTMWAHTPTYSADTYTGQQGHHVQVPGVSDSDISTWSNTRMNHTPTTLSDTLTSLGRSTVSRVSHQAYTSTWMQQHIEHHMEQSLQAPVYWHPVAVSSVWRDAGYLADEIVWFLERRVSFRILKRALARMAEGMPDIQGVRVAVSGRVGGRSKKSQRARCDVWKYGATPLHVFSREIDYAQRVAHTPLGTSGVSVWLVRRA